MLFICAQLGLSVQNDVAYLRKHVFLIFNFLILKGKCLVFILKSVYNDCKEKKILCLKIYHAFCLDNNSLNFVNDMYDIATEERDILLISDMTFDLAGILNITYF